MRQTFLLFLVFFSIISTLHSTKSDAANDTKIVDLNPGESVDAYFEVNLSGKLFIYIVAEPGGEACADFWWIKWPFGRNENTGRFCNEATLDIPGWTSLAISSKLRAGGAKNRVKIAVRANEEVAYKQTIKF
ncbi:MAG: hypothetical protein H8J66_02655 [Nitrospira sp.]|nr:hypothetical protein [Nitrospira sp.]